jgi:acylphosphatase
MRFTFRAFFLYAILSISVLAGCVSGELNSAQPGKERTARPEGPVRLTAALYVALDYGPYIREISDEAERYRMKGYVRESGRQKLELVLEGEREKIDKFFDRVIEIGRICGNLAQYDMPVWSDATGECKSFIQRFDLEPPE